MPVLLPILPASRSFGYTLEGEGLKEKSPNPLPEVSKGFFGVTYESHRGPRKAPVWLGQKPLSGGWEVRGGEISAPLSPCSQGEDVRTQTRPGTIWRWRVRQNQQRMGELGRVEDGFQ